jgi:hypothetical protein
VETILSSTPGCAALGILPLRLGSEEPTYSHWLTTAVLAHKHVPHRIQEWKRPLMVLASHTTGQLLSSSRDWYEPPLKGISLGGVLASLGVVCAVRPSTSPIITPSGEPLTDNLVVRRILLSRHYSFCWGETILLFLIKQFETFSLCSWEQLILWYTCRFLGRYSWVRMESESWHDSISVQRIAWVGYSWIVCSSIFLA